MVQNVGDGSLFHSSYLNIRFCVAAGANITFKILYNGAIANTGAQAPVGARSVPALTRLLAEEGVTRIALVTKTPRRYARRTLGAVTRVYAAERHGEAMRDLAAERGVTVLIYDGDCANERRRRQKRGTAPRSNRFVVINEDVCEACGHCGELTNCMSLQRVDTEFGEKTQVHPSTCNQDQTCLGGDCPSFLTVDTRAGTGYAKRRPPALPADAVGEPERGAAADRPYHVYVPGVGGTGVITVNALLAWAALIDGKRVLSYDQTGAAQKWGPVLSSLVVAPHPEQAAASKVGLGTADLYLALDPLASAAPANLDRCAPDRTGLVCVTSIMPTGEMVRTGAYGAPLGAIRESIARHCRPDRTVFADARWAAEGLFGDHMMVNVLAVGVAYQAGLLPVSAEGLERAIRLNGVAVEDNLQAFRYGRLYYHDPTRVETLVRGGSPTVEETLAAAVAALAPDDRRAWERLKPLAPGLDEESARMLALRAAELIAYQDAAYAERYVAFVGRVAAREREVTTERHDLTRAVIRYLYKLMAYKDEYEVARLHLKPAVTGRIAGLFDAPERVAYHFHPPLLRALGLQRKLELGPWFRPALRLLRRLRGLRGTGWDPFGRAAVRREERRLPEWYAELVTRALGFLRPETYEIVLEVMRLPDAIRGYEDIKLRSVAAARTRAFSLIERLESTRVESFARPPAAPRRPN
jgi:indolepyruvate ferredoxin oxidoreductase